MIDVSMIRCADYEAEHVEAALRHVVDAVGGLDFIKPGMCVGLKVNLVAAAAPERGVTTHPAVICALIRLLREKGVGKIIVGDSPGGLYAVPALQHIYAASGLKRCEDEGAHLNRNCASAHGDFAEAVQLKSFTYTAWLNECDAIINCCKLKSHGMMGMTASVKNLFGAIPGTMKPEYHFSHPNERDFADMLVDLNLFFKPALNIVDAILGMEGNGPTAGKPRMIGALGASKSPFALDLACAEIIGLTADDVPTLRAAALRNLAPESVQALNVDGDLQTLKVPDFENVRTHKSLRFRGSDKGMKKLIGIGMEAVLASRPGLKPDECIGCGVCFRTCPAKAITMVNKKPKIQRSKCIRCFCCQEFCPKGAMKVRRTLIAKMLNREGK